MVGYKLTRRGAGKWIFCGTTPEEIASAVKGEIEANEGLSVGECDQMVLRPFEISQEEIDAMPDFPGW